LGGDARDRVAGFLRALGALPDPECDHLTVLLTAYGRLRDGPRDGPAGHAAAALLHEHLLSWLPLYLDRVRALRLAPYPRWAELLTDVLAADAERAGTVMEMDVPLHLRAAPPLPDPRSDGRDAFVEGLLSPVRSGMVLTGIDLRAAARELQLGLRVGERRFVLDALLGQDPVGTLQWLAEHTRTTVTAWAPWIVVARPTATWWVARADVTRVLLHSVAVDAGGTQSIGAGR
jgi:hypothetical protein